MKAISIKNPWARLIAIGLKDVENRTWPTSFRGRVLIHASAKIDPRYREMSNLFTFDQWNAMDHSEQLKAVKGIYDSSAIIGEVEILDCIQDSTSVWAEPGCYHWVLSNAKLYDEPIRNVKGALSFWQFNP